MAVFFRHLITQHSALMMAILLILIMLVVGQQQQFQYLTYYREGIHEGQYWRLLTAHFVHLNWLHCIMNITGVLILGRLFGTNMTLQTWLVASCLLAFGISMIFYQYYPQLEWYVGYSGVLHGIWCIGAFRLTGIMRTTLLLGLLIKLLLEYYQLGTDTWLDFPVVYAAHLWGGIGGLIYYVSWQCLKRCL